MASKKKNKPKKKKIVLKKKSAKRRVVRRRPKPKARARKKKSPSFVKPHLAKPVAKPPEEETIHRTKVRVIGIGGGGGSIVSEIASKVRKADFLIANTDIRALNEAPKGVKRFHFGQSYTRGLGTGMNSEIGEIAAENEKEKIKGIFEGQDLCIIIGCLGGGTSSGSTPTFARAARSTGALTLGIFTMPFDFEGEKKMIMAKTALEKIKSHLNAYAVIPNERIFQIIDKNTPLKTALSAINKRLAENLEGLLEMVYLPGLINIDFADLRTVLEGRGRLAYLNTLEIEKENKEESVKKVIAGTLYPYTIKGARGVLYDISGGKDLQLSEVSQISKMISELINKSAKIIFGISQKPIHNNRIKITVLATGCTSKIFGLNNPKALSPLVSTIEKIKSIGRTSKSSEGPQKKRSKVKKQQAPTTSEKSKAQKKEKPKKKMAKKLKTMNKKTVKTIAVPKAKEENGTAKVRRNALELKKVAEEEEKKILEQENEWETPAIFRKKEIQR